MAWIRASRSIGPSERTMLSSISIEETRRDFEAYQR
jgi:hypothetical protein